MVEISEAGIKREILENLDKEQLVNFIMANKPKLIQNKQKNNPFIDKDGKMHKKEYVGRKDKKPKMDFSKVKKTRIAIKFSYIGKNYQGLVI